MCSHYESVISPTKLKQYFDVDLTDLKLRDDLWPGYIGPFIRKHEYANVGDEAVPTRELLAGSFGLVPHWARDSTMARNTYNARSETVHEKPSFRDSWKSSRHCIIPAEAIYEPDWRSGKAVGTRIVRMDEKPMGIAGLWSSWKNPQTAQVLHSFTMLTVNADDHEFMRNYHKPQDEKRMVVILQDIDYEGWLNAKPEESRFYLRQYPAHMMSVVSGAVAF